MVFQLTKTIFFFYLFWREEGSGVEGWDERREGKIKIVCKILAFVVGGKLENSNKNPRSKDENQFNNKQRKAGSKIRLCWDF